MESKEDSSSIVTPEGKTMLLDFGFKTVLDDIVVSHHATILSMLTLIIDLSPLSYLSSQKRTGDT